MNRLLRRTLFGLALGVFAYVAFILYSDVQALANTLRNLSYRGFLLALLASSLNYLLRFAKWELCLRWLHVRGSGPGDARDLTVGRSLLIYIAGLSMSITPGKLGEVLRSTLLKATDQVPFARTAPIVIADRLTDLVALVLITLAGLSALPQALPYALAAAGLVGAGVLLLGSPRWLHAILDHAGQRFLRGKATLVIERLRVMIDSAAALLRLRHLLVLTVLSVLGWGLECIGYFLIVNDFPGVEGSLEICGFLWAATTLIGALSFMPGGLGATEASLGWLALKLTHGMTEPIALASTLLIRGATLWYGEVLGALALAWLLRDPKLRERAELVRAD